MWMHHGTAERVHLGLSAAGLDALSWSRGSLKHVADHQVHARLALPYSADDFTASLRRVVALAT